MKSGKNKLRVGRKLQIINYGAAKQHFSISTYNLLAEVIRTIFIRTRKVSPTDFTFIYYETYDIVQQRIYFNPMILIFILLTECDFNSIKQFPKIFLQKIQNKFSFGALLNK